MQILVRVILDDRPGALSRAASAIANVGANILAMDVVDRDDKSVVDDFVVQLDNGGPEELARSLSSLPDTVVECIRETPQAQLHQELELISTLASDARPSLDLLARLVPAIVRCDWAVVISSAGTAVAITHASMNGPRIRWTSLPWLPLQRAMTLDPRGDWMPSSLHADDLSFAAAPVNPETSVLSCRETGPTFRPSEVERLAQLARLGGRLLSTETSQSTSQSSRGRRRRLPT